MTVALHHTSDGPPDAPALVLGSSLGTAGAMWQPQVEALTRRFRVIRFDHRGHGASPVPPGPYSIEQLGRDVLALLDRLELAKAHLAGLSLGGSVALWVAANAPERVDRLAVLSSAARFGTPESWAQRAAAVRAGGVVSLADSILARWFTPEFARRHAGVVAWVRRMLTTTSSEGYAACCAALETMDLGSSLARVTAPTLVVGGADDPAGTDGVSRVAAGVAGSRLEIVPGAHLVNVEQPEVVNRLLLDFLSPG